MDRIAFFVDAGYLFAQGSVAITGHKAPRESIVFDAQQAIQSLRSFANSKVPHCRLLRIYWYDGARFGMGQTTDHATLAHLDDVKLRLGFVNNYGQQKGVDSLIVTDLIELARLKSITDAVLISGDEDVRVGVQIAQSYGVRVHLIGIYPSRGSQSPQLQQEADTTTEWAAPDLAKYISVRPQPPPFVPNVAPSQAPVQSDRAKIEAAVKRFVEDLNASEIGGVETFWKTDRGVPADLDRRLLPACGQAIGKRLEREEMKLARAEFQRAITVILASKRARDASN